MSKDEDCFRIRNAIQPSTLHISLLTKILGDNTMIYDKISTGIPKRILIIDNDIETKRVFQEAFGDSSEILSVTNLQDAQSEMKDFHPEYIVIETALYPISGFEMCRRIRQIDKNVDILLITSKHVKPNDKARAIRLGADGYLKKPLNADMVQKETIMIYKKKCDK